MAQSKELFFSPGDPPEPFFSDEELVFTAEEKKELSLYKTQYPNAEGPVMKALWLAQNKFGFLPPEVIRLVAREMELTEAHVFGVATFYTQYYKQKMGRYVLDVCTCFSCQLCGGYDILHHLENKLGIKKGETTDDGLFSIQEAECLGACGSAPMMQITNGPYMHNLTPRKIDELIDQLRQGRMPEFVSVTLPQDEVESEGRRRSDVTQVETYKAPPVAETLR